MNRKRRSTEPRKEQRARNWIAQRIPEAPNRSVVRDAREGAFFVKREVDTQKTDLNILGVIEGLHQEQPSLEAMKVLSVSIISPSDGSRLQNVARQTDGSLHLGRIKEKVETDFSDEVVMYLGEAACFGARKDQSGKRFVGWHLYNAAQTLKNERLELINMYDTEGLFNGKKSPHISVAGTKDQVQVEAAQDALRAANLYGSELVLKPAEFRYVNR